MRVERSTARIGDEFQSFVRPSRNPRLSDFCTRLTSITQQQVDSASTFPDAFARFAAWVGSFENATFCSWGGFDRLLLRQACRYHRIEFPFNDDYVNIKPAFSEIYTGRGVSLERALEVAELKPMGHPHRAIDDARNAARLWSMILQHRSVHGHYVE